MHKAKLRKAVLACVGLALGLSLLFSPVPASAPALAEPPAPLVAPYIVRMWEKVAWCETHSHWWVNQPTFDGGLGISRVNWQTFAPSDFPDAPHLATKEQQVFVARKIQAWGGVPNYIPDQAGGCHAW